MTEQEISAAGAETLSAEAEAAEAGAIAKTTEDEIEESKKYSTLTAVAKWSSIIGIIACVLLVIAGIATGVLTSEEKLKEFIEWTGPFGGIVFTLVQIIQVVIPIIPGGVSCLVGVVLFGPLMGYIYNYVGCCVGSVIAFAISKRFGRPILYALFKPESIEKYDKWTSKNNRFTKLFAIAIFLPVAPDDMLCYLAGTTQMSFKTFNIIIWTLKPFCVGAYSLLLYLGYDGLKSLLGGLF